MTYDRDSDVLYISARQTFAARGVEDSHGVVWRYNPAEDLIGVTVVDFLDQAVREATETGEGNIISVWWARNADFRHQYAAALFRAHNDCLI